jgi:hypothetical protein
MASPRSIATARGAPDRRVLGSVPTMLATLVVLLAAFHPAHGLGRSICVIESALSAPCPGCGLTRSLSCAVRGMWSESMAYHPLGPAVLGVLGAMAVAGALPARARSRMATILRRHPRAYATAYWGGVAVFIIVGIARLVP